jgi:hypothetical protein
MHTLPPLANGQTGARTLTQDQVFSLLRARSTDSPKIKLQFALVRKVDAAPGGAQAAADALQEAQTRHLDLYRDGILVDLMRSGGFLVLEYDLRTNTALRLDIVSVDGTGVPAVQSSELLESTSQTEALQLLDRAAIVSDPFFGRPGTAENFREVARDFGESATRSFGSPEGPMCQVAPDALLALAKPEELSDLTSLACDIYLWPLRHSLAYPVYAANPHSAFMMAGAQLNKLIAQFPLAHGNEANFVNQQLDLSTIRTRDDLAARIETLRTLDIFLSQHSAVDYTAPTFVANAFISHIPLEFGTDHDVDGIPGRSYGVMSAPGLMTHWSRTQSGTFALRIIAETEY